jgi:hypothetical protein
MRSVFRFLYFFLFLTLIPLSVGSQEYAPVVTAATYVITVAGMGSLSISAAIIGTAALTAMVARFIYEHGGDISSAAEIIRAIESDFNKKKKPLDSCGPDSPMPKDPKKPNKNERDDEFKQRHPHGRYEDASYHRAQQSGRKSPRSLDGQKALDNSFLIEDSNGARVGVSHRQIVILKRTSPGIYHGYVVQWNDTSAASAIKVLIKEGIINRRGKFLV